MSRVLCYTEDRKLLPILSPALGPNYQLTVETDKAKVQQLLADGRADVLILDFDSNYGSAEDGLDVF